MNKIAIVISSKNNYEMLEKEVIKNNEFQNFTFINIDDNSDKDQIKKGREICRKNNIVFLQNENIGIQWAVHTAISSLDKKIEWIICLQHDCYPISEDFYKRINKLVLDKKLREFGAIGFNFLQEHNRNSDLMSQIGKYYCGERELGCLGLMHFSYRPFFKFFLSKRSLSKFPTIPNDNIIRKIIYFLSKNNVINENFRRPFIIEMPWWPIVGINIKAWKKFINPTNKLKLHLWFPDVMMTLNYNNFPCLILPNLYCLNNQSLKSKYNIMRNSAEANKNSKQMKRFFGEYGSHLKFFKEKWGWDYERVRWTLTEKVLSKYKGTLIYKFSKHDIKKGPLKSYNLGYY